MRSFCSFSIHCLLPLAASLSPSSLSLSCSFGASPENGKREDCHHSRENVFNLADADIVFAHLTFFCNDLKIKTVLFVSTCHAVSQYWPYELVYGACMRLAKLTSQHLLKARWRICNESRVTNSLLKWASEWSRSFIRIYSKASTFITIMNQFNRFQKLLLCLILSEQELSITEAYK